MTLVRRILLLLFRCIAFLVRAYGTFLIAGVCMGISAAAAGAVGLGLFELAKAITLLLAQFGIHVRTLPDTGDVVGLLFAGTGMVTSFGFMAFWFRSKHRLAYSILEILVGALIGLLAIDQYPFAKRLHVETGPLFALLGGIYIVVSGLENLDKWLPNGTRLRRAFDRLLLQQSDRGRSSPSNEA